MRRRQRPCQDCRHIRRGRHRALPTHFPDRRWPTQKVSSADGPASLYGCRSPKKLFFRSKFCRVPSQCGDWRDGPPDEPGHRGGHRRGRSPHHLWVLSLVGAVYDSQQPEGLTTGEFCCHETVLSKTFFSKLFSVSLFHLRQQSIRDYRRLQNAFVEWAWRVFKNHERRFYTDVYSICVTMCKNEKDICSRTNRGPTEDHVFEDQPRTNRGPCVRGPTEDQPRTIFNLNKWQTFLNGVSNQKCHFLNLWSWTWRCSILTRICFAKPMKFKNLLLLMFR